MDAYDYDYTVLCSSETLRSGKQGFFRDFSEQIMLVAGEAWIATVFGGFVTDEDRIRAVFTERKIKDLVVDTLRRVQPIYRDKDAEISKLKRLEAIEYATAGEHEKALLVYSQAILRAPLTGICPDVDDGFSLPMALLRRAEVLMALKEYDLALEDLEVAAEGVLSDALQADWKMKKDAVEGYLESQRKGLVPVNSPKETERNVLPPLAGGPNPRMPTLSSKIDIIETAGMGKHAIAVKDIVPGDCLAIEPPVSTCILPRNFGTHCQLCHARIRAPLGCPKCSCVTFCGKRCRDIALSTFHKYECQILGLLIGSGMSILSMLSLRMITQETLETNLMIYNKIKNKEIGNTDANKDSPATIATSKSEERDYTKMKLAENSQENEDDRISSKTRLELAYDLIRHEETRTPTDFLERSLMTAFLLKCLQRVNYFENPSSDDEVPNEQEIAIGSLMLRNLQLLQFNAHEYSETHLGADHRFRGSRSRYLGVALYATLSRFNHNCYPAVARHFVGRKVVIQAVRNLKPGEMIGENYGPIFTKRTLEQRQMSLSSRYWFKCQCVACREDWVCFENQINESAKLRCPTPGCTGLHRQPKRSNTWAQCDKCNENVNLASRYEVLKICENNYVRGMEMMEEEKVREAMNLFEEGIQKFHEIAVPPHKDTHVAEIALSVCMADYGNTWRTPVLE